MTAPTMVAGRPSGLRAGRRLAPGSFARVRARTLLEGCKWDPQVGDAATLADFPLVLPEREWAWLARQAEQLAAEAALAEVEIAGRPECLRQLGMPAALRAVLADQAPLTPAAARVIRFDFHPTTEGWRISEANSDVPGGYGEASRFTELMAEHYEGLHPAGDTSVTLGAALMKVTATEPTVALLAAPRYMEDQQVVAFLAQALRARGLRAVLAKPEQLVWTRGEASLATDWYAGPVGAIVRFYQAEWLARLPAQTGWQHCFRGGSTPVMNPPLAVISESKRFPLVWDQLATPLPTWRALLPETRAPAALPWRTGRDWLLKTAYGNTGDTVSLPDLLSPAQWWRTRLTARLAAKEWLAQRRFTSVPIATPAGDRHVCVGVYTVNGCAAGAYARLAPRPLIDFAATDVPLLLEPHDQP